MDFDQDPLYAGFARVKMYSTPQSQEIVTTMRAVYTNRELIRQQITTLTHNHRADPAVTMNRGVLKNFSAEIEIAKAEQEDLAAKLMFAWDTDNHGFIDGYVRSLQTMLKRQAMIMEMIGRITARLSPPEGA
jgi:hypothetical protein